MQLGICPELGMRDAPYCQLLMGTLCWIEIDHAAFARYDWSTFVFGHLEQQEEISGNAPQEKGIGFITAKVDASHDGVNPVAPCLPV